ncbi:hypothetical protein PC129_g15344 [Phytophthora cactorum]|uniref:Marvel domain n=3 Tax=Phytophthora cactorum TaxID=29920 RepID=A0A8T1HP29_9STRA|nr:hypothetical protein Pcac1_g10013 [Phytophthora cactorum]KAG2904093.1 hypothetical protein PC114_g11984 [Phytophthora cactorum]KAG3015820.1 hypothetical protein PC119_g11612 [Phytophthora cactorum]KAG3050198.1 hypothetical protein PC121_g18520 [Phytophthora cactorum]KAG3213736.1 hypothetical protein PC129_g15344 [Phytophthora cactorum]
MHGRMRCRHGTSVDTPLRLKNRNQERPRTHAVHFPTLLLTDRRSSSLFDNQPKMPTAMEDASTKARKCINNPKMLITYMWFVTMLFGFMYAIAAIVAAVNNDGEGESDSKSLGFVGVWAMILIVALSVGGTMVMRKHQTPLAVGFLIGVVLMMSLQMFSLSIIFAGAAYLARIERAKGDEHTNVHSNEAGSVFSFFMFVCYLAFTIVLVRHRNIVIKEGVNLDPNAINNDIEKNPAGTGGNGTSTTTTATSPRVIRTDLDVPVPLAPPVSV